MAGFSDSKVIRFKILQSHARAQDRLQRPVHKALEHLSLELIQLKAIITTAIILQVAVYVRFCSVQFQVGQSKLTPKLMY